MRNDHHVHIWRWLGLGRLLATVLFVAACSVQIPQDPDGTLDRVRGDVLRVGVSHNPPWTSVDGNEPSGIEPELVREFAKTIDADVEWTIGGEETLVHQLEEGRLDLVIGGFTAKSPWVEHVALTRPYTTAPSASGEPEKYVMAVAKGENAFLVALERFLLAQDVQP
jgi:polar amino acid transport system substrate-binding protein